MKRAALKVSAGLSLLFVVVYPVCNWLASRRTDVGTWAYAWEQKIPFVPWLIFPYWSIDLFFVAAPFVCRDRAELRVLAQRVACAIVAAGICFVAMPLRIVFPRPEVTGVPGMLFSTLWQFDQPHNLFPSLHIALWLILRAVYVRHTGGATRWLVRLWFLAIGLSAVLTWQHQVVDVAGGVALATVCFYLFRETNHSLPVRSNYRVGVYYVAVAVVAAVAGGFAWWVTLATGLVALGYFGIGPGVYRKENGALPLAARLILGPVLAGQWLSLRYYRRQCRAWDEIVPGVFLGRVLSDAEAATLPARAVLDLTAEFSESPALRTRVYRNIPMLDLTAPTVAQLREAVDFVAAHVGKGGVYVHCKIGYSRSATVVGAYLMRAGQAGTVQEAVAKIRAARPALVVRSEAMAALRSFAEKL